MMKLTRPRSLRAFLLLAALCGSTSWAWTGPQTTVANLNGRKVLRICDNAGNNCQFSTPFFLALNTELESIATRNDWSRFDYQAQLLVQNVGVDLNGVAPILEVHLLNRSPAFLDQLLARLNALNPRPYLHVRTYLYSPTAEGLEKTKLRNLAGDTKDDSGDAGSLYALSASWINQQKLEIENALTYLDQRYPGRVLGLHISYMNGGEWFFRPHGFIPQMVHWGHASLCDTWEGVTQCKLHPWSNDSGETAGPRGRHSFYMHDYSATSEAGFCSWSMTPAVLKSAGCRAASPLERNNADPTVLTKPELGRARGAFLNPAEPGSLRAAWYNQFISQQVVTAISDLLQWAKQVSGHGKLLTSTFHGYLNGLNPYLPASGQTAYTELLKRPSVDITAAPYSYGSSRALGAAFLPQGPAGAPELSGKLWFDEDDTRTHLACLQFKDDACILREEDQAADTLWDSIRLLRRNLLTAGLQGRGSWFLDLTGTGWFGRPDRKPDSEALWANLQNAFKAVSKLQKSAPNAFKPQVAVFVDDYSMNYMAALTPAGSYTPNFGEAVYVDLYEQLSKLGTPVRQYLLSDLLKPGFDTSSIRFAIFANAFNVTPEVRQAINDKLKSNGRSLLFIYAAGYLSGDAAPSAASISALTGLNVTPGGAPQSLTQNITLSGGQTVPGGVAFPLTPWFVVSDSGAEVLGRYTTGSGVSLATRVIQNGGTSFRSIYAAAPRLPLQVLRQLSEQAGVHHFAAAGDIVEAAGNMVMLHAAAPGSKTLRFPEVMPRIFETAIYPADQLKCSWCSQLTGVSMSAGDTLIFRWTAAPYGNFEGVSSTGVASGWAADTDVTGAAVSLHAYAGGDYATGIFVGGGSTTLPRGDVNAALGISGDHGFSFQLPASARGKAIYVYAQDAEGQDTSRLIGIHTWN